jgi:hypothetical protein
VTQQVDVSVLRPDDLLNLEISAVNLRLDATDGAHPMLVVDDPQEPALLVVRFPAQTTFEEAFFDDSPSGDPNDPGALPPEQKQDPPKPPPAPPPGMHTIAGSPPGKVRFRLGGDSRLVFRVPPQAQIPYTIEGLLDWSPFDLVVAPIADVPAGGAPPADPTIREPAATESTLQLPFRLHLSPTHATGWVHATGVVEHDGRAELWHTRLAARGRDGALREADDEHTIGLRAIWSPDYAPGQPVPSPGQSGMSDALAPMDIADRHQIVILTSAFDGYAKNAYRRFVPTPIQARMVMLSPLGGWLRSFGAWDPPTKIKPRRRLGGIRLDEVFRRSELLRIAGGEAPHAIVPDREVVQPAPAPAPAPQAAQAASGRFAGPVSSATLNLDPELSSLTRFELDKDGALDLSQWAHVAAQGRDHYVRIVYEGRFKDIGHRASLVKVTERRFEPPAPGAPPVAYLRQYMYIVVREPERVYSGLADDGRGLPFRRLRLTTLVTPHINYPYPPSPAAITDRSFWVMVGGADFHFHGYGEDHDGRPVDFNRALIFVPNSETQLADINTKTRNAAARARLRMAVPGQKLAYAPGGGGDNTTFVTQSIDVDNEGDAREPFFSPRMWKADVVVPAVEALTGAGSVTQIRYEKTYLAGGFGAAANKTGLFAQVVHQKGDVLDDTGGLAVAFNAQQAGGFSTPSLDVKCLTRATGPLGGTPDQALADAFVPADVFKKGLATLFGVFDLADLVPGAGSASDRAPKMVTRREASAIVTELDWVSPVDSLPLGIVEFQANGDTQLTVNAELRKEIGAAGAGSFKLDGRLNHFQIEFIKSLQIRFDAFTFAVRAGSKTDVDVALDAAQPVLFKGDLAFVEGLRQIIPPGVFGDGVSIDLIAAPPGVKAGLSIGLPPAVVGVFSLKNIAFSAGLTIPFVSGKPVVEFGFARRDQPFLLAVMIFGGGGFFHIELDTDGMRMLEASFEFGATAALDIGVASGEVHIMAGIYFKMEKKPVAGLPGEQMVSSLSGYLRCGGSLSVLGIVRISVEFLLSFTYYAAPEDKAKGRATLTVEIEVLCFSKSIELTVERAFGGKGGDPTFEQMFDTPELWAEYAAAFA